jgi:excisionase family DNA binding protein
MYGIFRTLKDGKSMTEELLSLANAAQIAECHNDTIRRALESGFLVAQRVGRSWVIKRSDLQLWIAAGKPNHRRPSPQQRDDGTGNSQ